MIRMEITGNLVREPGLHETRNQGVVVANITLADNYKRNADAQEEVTYVDVTLFGTLAENFVASAVVGMRCVATGRVKQEEWEGRSGEKRSKLVLIADSCGPDLRFAQAVVTKSSGPGQRQSSSPRPAAARQEPSTYSFDDEPF